jgi:POT family proton-dependent oligopeptide transporter
VAGLLGKGMSLPDEHATKIEKLTSYTNGYYQLAIIAMICGVLLLICSKQVKKLMQDVK